MAACRFSPDNCSLRVTIVPCGSKWWGNREQFSRSKTCPKSVDVLLGCWTTVCRCLDLALYFPEELSKCPGSLGKLLFAWWGEFGGRIQLRSGTEPALFFQKVYNRSQQVIESLACDGRD